MHHEAQEETPRFRLLTSLDPTTIVQGLKSAQTKIEYVKETPLMGHEHEQNDVIAKCPTLGDVDPSFKPSKPG